MYHISDLKKFSICPRLYILEKENPRPPLPPFIRLHQTVGNLAAEKLHIAMEQAFIGHAGDDEKKARMAMQTSKWLIQARFEADSLRIKVPFMHRVDQAWDVYFLSLSLYPSAKDNILYGQSIIWVLKQNGIVIRNIQVIHLNAEYVRKGKLEAEKLFTVSAYFYNVHHHPTVLIKEAIDHAEENPARMMRQIDRMPTCAYPPAIHNAHCCGRSICRFYSSCFPLEAKAPANSILTLNGTSDRYAMWKENRTVLKKADPGRIAGTPQQYAEIMADRKDGQFVDRLALCAWLSQLKPPISFLDFEWERYALPPYDGMRPLGVLPFAYSLHVQEQNRILTHTFFLSVHDDREKMIQSLLQEIPAQGSVVAYNAIGAEMIRIQELAEQFPKYETALWKLNKRMIDLQVPFTSGMIYDTRLGGHWTLKKIMSLLQDKGYQNLSIHDGMEAVYQWRHLERKEQNADAEAIVADLKAYCSMDTYAMAMVLSWLGALVQV